MFRYSGGDGRKLLNVLEIVVDSSAGDGSRIVIDNETVTNCLQENMAIYDKDGEMHYDIISAFIKSIRTPRSTISPGCWTAARIPFS